MKKTTHTKIQKQKKGFCNLPRINNISLREMEGNCLSVVTEDEEVFWGKETEPFFEFSVSIQKLNTVLNELNGNKLMSTPPIRQAVESLEIELRRAKALISSPKYRSSPTKLIEDITENLGRSLGLVLFASHDISLAGKENIETLRREMMNTGRFSTTASSESKSEFIDDIESEEEIMEEMGNEITEEEEEKVDGDGSTLSIDDVISHLRYGNDDQLKRALLRLNALIGDCAITNEWIDDEGIIPILFTRMSSTNPLNRLTVIQILRTLTAYNDGNKEKMAELGYLSTLVKSLTRDEEEQREAVGLLFTLSNVSAVRRRIGRIQGCIVMLVAIFNGEDVLASHDAGKLLTSLSSNNQNALHMAEAGYFKPLVKYLKEGSDMSKILMATAISRMELRDETSASIGEEGAIEPLIQMFKEGKLEAKLSSLSALQNLSTLKENTHRLITSGIVPLLLQLLFSVTSVLMTLREPASAILARIAQSESILVNQDIAIQMLSLLNLSSPVIQCHLFQALNSIAAHSGASKVRRKMKENGSVQLLLPFLSETNLKIRTGALSLISTLSEELSEELVEQLGETHLLIIVNILSSSPTEGEKALAANILSNVPITDKKATDILKKANLLPILVSIVSTSQASLTLSLAESIAGLLIRFTVPSDKKLQYYSAENGVIPVLVKLLSNGSSIAKRRAATSLTQLSQNSLSLRKSRKSRWLCVPPSADAFCEIHDGFCFPKSTFCLVKAGAVAPLIHILESNEREADEAVLGALSTLLLDEIWESGSYHLAKMSGVEAILNVLEKGTLKAQQKAAWMLERIFRVEALRVQYGEPSQALLIHITQNGDSMLKPVVAKLLAQLELLQNQSSYF